MKILIINEFYFPNMIGGAEHSVKLLAENLTLNHEVAVYCFGNVNELLQENINGVDVFRGRCGYYKPSQICNISTLKKFSNKILELNNIFIEKEYKNVLAKFNPDIVHINNLYGMSTTIWNITKEAKIPIIHTLRDYELLEPIKQIPYLSSLLNKKRSNEVDVVTSPSSYTLDKFVKKGFFMSSKKLVVPNAIELNFDETKKIIDHKLSINNEKVSFLFVGMLTHNKGIDVLLNSFFNIDNPKIELIICGQGELKPIVQNYSNQDQRIQYLGQLNKNQLKNIYINSDVLIVPSIWEEPFGRVVIEGNQFGLPVIGSNRGGIKEIIDNIHTGVLFDPESDNELVAAINKFSDRNYIKTYYKSILEGIKNYSIQNQIATFENLYQTIIEKNIQKYNTVI